MRTMSKFIWLRQQSNQLFEEDYLTDNEWRLKCVGAVFRGRRIEVAEMKVAKCARSIQRIPENTQVSMSRKE